MPIEIDTREEGGALIIRLAGSGGVPEAPEIESALTLAAAKRAPLTVFDLSGLDFISSLVVGAMNSYRTAAQRHDGEVRFAGITEPIKLVIHRGRLDDVWDIRASVEDALR